MPMIKYSEFIWVTIVIKSIFIPIGCSALLLSSYLIGSTMSAIWIAKIFKLPDPRSYGSGNPGATNMARSNHKVAALMTFILDICKGILSTGLAIMLGYSQSFGFACGAMALLGHIFPLFHDFKGGKGAATYFGVVLVLNQTCGLIAFLTWSSTLLLFRNSGLSAIITSIISPVIISYTPGMHKLTVPATAASLVIILVHRQNIQALLSDWLAQPNQSSQ